MPSTIDGFTLGKTLGSGFSAKVKLGTSQDGTEYALKIFRLDNPNFNERAFKLLQEEVAATTQLDNKHVVKYFEFKENAQWIKSNGSQIQVAYIAQEMIPGGELFDYVANSGPFSEAICKYYFKQMLQGIHYIHSKGFSHRDLKPENILLDKMYDIKIVDFGFACPLSGRDESGFSRSVIGTPGYMAPEIIARQPYQGQVVDLFALGVILFILYSGHPPFGAANDQDNFYKLLATNRSDLFWKAHSQRKEEGFYSEEFKDLITCMLQFHPHQRLCIADIIGHPWIASGAISSPEEVRAEFAQRHETNKQRAQADEEKKALMRNKVKQGIHRALDLNGKVYLSFGEEAPEEIPLDKEIVKLTCKDYRGNENKTHAFFSTFKPDVLFQELAKQLGEESQTFTMSDSSWKLTFDLEKKIFDEDDVAAADQQIDGGFMEKAKVQVEICKVPDQDKYCVDFQRKAGSSVLFYDNVNKYMDLLELCNNTTMVE